MREYRKWTSPEINRLKAFYHVMPIERLKREFYPRSLNSLHHMAKTLGLRRKRDWQSVAAQYTPIVFSVPHRVPCNSIAAPNE
jgi:hypothetical protein